MSEGGNCSGTGIERRQVLQALGASAAVGLAGCLGGDDELEDHERVPTLTLEYWAGRGGVTSTMESTAPVVQDACEELGIDLEIEATDFVTQIGNNSEDLRTHEIMYWQFAPGPDRLDPHEMSQRFALDWAGGNGHHSNGNYANCEVSEAAWAQASARSLEEREELVNECHSKLSDDYQPIPIVPRVGYAGYRTDEVDLQGAGEAGIIRVNSNVYIKSEPINGDEIIAYTSPEMLETTNFPVIDSSQSQGPWNNIIHSPLVGYDEHYDLQNVLASDYEVSDDGEQVTVELRDATFHNGDPITAEDVQFTFQQLADNAGTYAQADPAPYESIDVVDDSTVEFNLEEPFLPLITRVWPRWGILHKETWVEGGAVEDPEGFSMDPIVGSGPFQVQTFDTGTLVHLEPHDGHPEFDPDHDLIFVGYGEEQALFQAFQANEVHMVSDLSPGIFERIDEEMDDAEAMATQYFLPFSLFPQFPVAPMKFRPVRHAIGKALNRQEMNQLGFFGESEPELASTVLMESHPWRPPEDQLATFTDDPTGDPEGAREVLEDAGFVWDDDDNLYYPEDADLEPLWPEGEEPSVDDFPCLEGQR